MGEGRRGREKGEAREEIADIISRVVALAMSPINDTFISGSLDDTVRLWDLRSNACQVFRPSTPLPSPSHPLLLSCSPLLLPSPAPLSCSPLMLPSPSYPQLTNIGLIRVYYDERDGLQLRLIHKGLYLFV